MSNGKIDINAWLGTTTPTISPTTSSSTGKVDINAWLGGGTTQVPEVDIRSSVSNAIDIGGNEDDDVIEQLKKWNDENDFGFKFSNPTIWGESVQVSFESEGPQGGNIFNTYKYELGDKDSLEGLIKF